MKNGKTARKILACLLVFVMVFGVNALSAFAEGEPLPEGGGVDPAA